MKTLHERLTDKLYDHLLTNPRYVGIRFLREGCVLVSLFYYMTNKGRSNRFEDLYLSYIYNEVLPWPTLIKAYKSEEGTFRFQIESRTMASDGFVRTFEFRQSEIDEIERNKNS